MVSYIPYRVVEGLQRPISVAVGATHVFFDIRLYVPLFSCHFQGRMTDNKRCFWYAARVLLFGYNGSSLHLHYGLLAL